MNKLDAVFSLDNDYEDSLQPYNKNQQRSLSTKHASFIHIKKAKTSMEKM